MKRVALAQAESAATVLAIVTGAVVASLVAVTFELLAAKAAGPSHVLVHGVFAAVTVVGSWLLLPLLFALSYAAAYYTPSRTAASSFPGATRLRARPHRLPLLRLHHRGDGADLRRRRLDPADAPPGAGPLDPVVRVQHHHPGVLDQRRRQLLLSPPHAVIA
jgi:hypothetical protein